MHLLVRLLQAKKDFAFLQRPAEVDELPGPRTGGTHLGEEIPLGSIGMDTTSITFRACLPKARAKASNPSSHAMTTPSWLSSSLSLSKKLPLLFNGHRM
jgi:hypothetical protein